MVKNSVLFGLLLLLVVGCKKKEPTNWDVDVIAPVVKTTLTIEDLIPDSVLNTNPDNSLEIVYQENLTSFNIDSIIKIPDTSISAFYTLPFVNPVDITPGFSIVNDPVTNQFSYGDTKLKTVKVKSGKISYTLKSSIAERTIYTYKILSAKDASGNVFEKTISVPAGSRNNPTVKSGQFDLDGYTFTLYDASTNTFNQIKTEAKVVTDPNGSTVQVSNLDTVHISNTMSDIIPEYATGYFGQISNKIGPKVIDFKLFDKITDGTLDVDQVNVDLEFKNYVGVDNRLITRNITSINNRTGNAINLNHPIVNSTINITRAQDNFTIVTPTIKTYNLNTSNSNIDLFFENLPDQFAYEFDVETNPYGNISNGNDFLYTDKTLEANLNVTVPLNLIANNLTLVDTINLGLDSIENPVNEGQLTIYAENWFPFNADLQLYMLNKQGTAIIDSVMVDNTILSSQVDANYTTVASTSSVLTAVFTPAQVQKLNENSKLLLKVAFTTASTSQHVKLYSNYKLDLKLTSAFNYNISIK